MDRKRFIPLGLALGIPVLAAFLVTGASVSAESPGKAPKPPTDEPGWVWVGDQTEIHFPDGAKVIIPDQEGIPEEQRIAWVRHDIISQTTERLLALPDGGGVQPLVSGPYTDNDYHRTTWCTGFPTYWCVIIDDWSRVYYYKDSGQVFVWSCDAKTARGWNNPYKYPQYSYDKVYSFERGQYGSYQPSGTAQANTWYGIAGCQSHSWHSGSTWVTFGSRWDTIPGWPTTTYDANYIYY